uniref:Putative secreted protein n=1 Tax=Anopheles triannulatus TaxID=58253 RepID=A0A2M4B2B2_9DIPT
MQTSSLSLSLLLSLIARDELQQRWQAGELVLSQRGRLVGTFSAIAARIDRVAGFSFFHVAPSFDVVVTVTVLRLFCQPAFPPCIH